MEQGLAPEVLDAALIGAAQKIEHYEISSYGTLRTIAQSLGMKDATRLLDQTLAEEKKTDEALTEAGDQSDQPRAFRVSEAGKRQAGAAK